ncbi:MAG: hypothetical protein PHN42_00160 [Bacilli bacterium]|nr:hypothetical protein [Bacilli bacterium]
MNKKITIILSVIIFVVTIFVIILLKNNYLKENVIIHNNERYARIKKDVEFEIIRYVELVTPICENNGGEMLITHKTMVYNGGFDKEKLLDVDNKSYCSVYALSSCNGENKHTYKIYIKCNDYEDNGFVQRDEPFTKK